MVSILADNITVQYLNADLVAIAKADILSACEKQFGNDKRKWIQILTSIQAKGNFKEPHKTACKLILRELNGQEK